MSKSSVLGWCACSGWQSCNCLRMPAAIRLQESRMPGNPLVRFDEGRVGRASAFALSPTLPGNQSGIPFAMRVMPSLMSMTLKLMSRPRTRCALNDNLAALDA